ncbi:hypothetical protein KR032_001796, partial [Drosophila birchii]
CKWARIIRMDEDELLDGLVEGIPMPSLRTSAKLQCFDSRGRKLRAFQDIRLPSKAPVAVKV